MRRRDFIKLVAVCAGARPLATHAQQATKIARVGILAPNRAGDSDPSLIMLNAFVAALQELGYTDGQNIVFERKFANGDVNRLRALANELVEQRVDVIVAISTTAARAAQQATSAIPIVAIGMADPVEDELVASLARPGGNVTGTAFLGPELVSRRLQLLKELVPRLSRVAVLWHPLAYSERTMTGMLKEIEGAANTLGTKLQFVPAAGTGDLEPAFAAMVRERAEAVIIFPSPMCMANTPASSISQQAATCRQSTQREKARSWGSGLLRREPGRFVPRHRRLSRQNPERRQTGGIAGAAANKT